MTATTAPKSSSRFLKFIAYLQIIGIIFVVIGHSFHEYPDGQMGHSLLLYRMMYSFRMPLFMFVSGFLMVFTTELSCSHPSWTKFTYTKIKRLLLPFIVLTLVTFIPRSLMSGIADDNINFDFTSFIRSFTYTDSLVIPFFWFLQSSFTLLVFNYAILTLAKKANINSNITYTLIISLFIILPLLNLESNNFFSIKETVRLGIFFMCGAAYANYHPTIDRFIPWSSIPFCLTMIALWAISFFAYENTALINLCSFIGIVMCISAAKIMEKHNINMLDHLIGANYIIFLLSWYFNVLFQQVLHHFVELPWWIYTILSIISGIYIPWLFYRYMLNHPKSHLTYLATNLLGQSFKQHRK